MKSDRIAGCGIVGLAMALLTGVAVRSAEAAQATIALRSGDVIQGEIQGALIQGEILELEQEGFHGAVYIKVNGADVAGIDARGVRYREGALVPKVVAIHRGQRPEQKDILTLMRAVYDNEDFAAPRVYITRYSPIPDVECNYESAGISAAALLGELRTDGKPADSLRVQTSGGLTTISLDDIVEFAKYRWTERQQ